VPSSTLAAVVRETPAAQATSARVAFFSCMRPAVVYNAIDFNAQHPTSNAQQSK
jgi:hypothetical protein